MSIPRDNHTEIAHPALPSAKGTEAGLGRNEYIFGSGARQPFPLRRLESAGSDCPAGFAALCLS